MTLPEKYTQPAVILHWLIAIGIWFNIGKMFFTDDHDRTRDIINMHKSVGITVLGLVVLRLLWRAANKPPALPANYAAWEVKLSKGIHHLLYLMIFAIPFSGWLMNSASLNKDTGQPYGIDLYHIVPWFNLPFFGGMEAATKHAWHENLGAVHATVAYLLLAVLVLHVLGALKHQFIDKDKELQRMWF